MKIHVLQSGWVKISKSLAFCDDINKPSLVQLSIASSYGRKNRRKFPVSMYLIEHEKGLILFDCGWSRLMSPKGNYSIFNQIKHMSLPLFLANQGFVPSGKSISDQLDNVPDFVILSHLDVDHVSGLNEVKDSKNILVSREEFEFASKNKLRYQSGMWKNINLKTFEFEQREPNLKNGPVGRVFDLFNDGSVELINIPGHTPGLSAMKLNNDGKSALLYSDGGYSTKSWKHMILPGICDDEDLAYKSLEWIREVSMMENCIESLANHDCDVNPHTFEL